MADPETFMAVRNDGMEPLNADHAGYAESSCFHAMLVYLMMV